jgi:hypothetical protein
MLRTSIRHAYARVSQKFDPARSHKLTLETALALYNDEFIKVAFRKY